MTKMDSSKSPLIGTAQVPPEHWKSARLIGSTPFAASRYDQRASYCMYIPESRYQVNPPRRLPLVVNVHGSLRRAERARDTLIPLANEIGCAILAPLFPAGVDDPSDMQGYKFLRHNETRYDLILLSMIDDEVSVRWPGIETEKFHLVGYSGGGQFASRFMLVHPERLLGISIGAPGVVTRLDWGVKWPAGLAGMEDIFDGIVVNVDKLMSIKHVQLVVGGKDSETPGGGLLNWFRGRKDKGMIDANKGEDIPLSLPNRIQALAGLRDELRETGVEAQYHLVAGVGHDYLNILPTIIEFLRASVSVAAQ